MYVEVFRFLKSVSCRLLKSWHALHPTQNCCCCLSKPPPPPPPHNQSRKWSVCSHKTSFPRFFPTPYNGGEWRHHSETYWLYQELVCFMASKFDCPYSPVVRRPRSRALECVCKKTRVDTCELVTQKAVTRALRCNKIWDGLTHLAWRLVPV